MRGDNLNNLGEGGNGAAVEKFPTRQHDVRQDDAISVGDVCDGIGYIDACEQPRNPDRATEKFVANRKQRNHSIGVCLQCVEHGPDRLSAEFAGDDVHRTVLLRLDLRDLRTLRQRDLCARRSVTVRWRAVDPRKEATFLSGCIKGFTAQRGMNLLMQCRDHADAIFVLQTFAIMGKRGQFPCGHEVILIARVHQVTPKNAAINRLPLFNDVKHSIRLNNSVRSHRWFVAVGTESEWHHTECDEPRKSIKYSSQRVVKDLAVIDPGAHHNLAMNFNVGIEEQLEPSQAGRSPTIA